jgi:glycosyltransferase involved in cell wall biosynthesis
MRSEPGPRVSVLVLTWNHEAFIRECLESILGESYRDVELICCENGSSDGTWAELQRIASDHPSRRIVLFQNPPGTPVNVGFNALIARATGDLVCFFSGDDLFCGDRIARQVAEFAAHPELEITYSNGRFLGGRQDGELVHDDARCEAVFRGKPKNVLRYVFENRGLMIQTFMAKLDLIRAIGGFDEGSLADDWILNIRVFSRLQRPNQYSYLPFASFLYRQHEHNSYKNFPRQSKLMVDVIEKYYRFPDRTDELARMYYFQANVGAAYGFRHLGLTLGYLRQALALRFSLKQLLMFPARFVLARPVRFYRNLRDERRARRKAGGN